ncbi:MAG: response regulator transcription factor, partial [Bacteroidia bacterium]|nr:response regulator transcription factor [Bacteroidia bacterium]
MKDTIKTVIVDDVESMRAVLKKLLDSFEKIKIVGEAADFEEAQNIISDERPDLLLLDIDLNGLTSIDLLKTIDYNPMVIFITSHADYAIKAFELNAVDYLLKPVSMERLTKAIEKVININDEVEIEPNNNEKFTSNQIILLSFDNKMNFIRVTDINYIEAFGNYTKVHLADGRLCVTYNSIKNWREKLPEEVFIQIHRSNIVNIENVTRIEKWANDTGRMFLKGEE